MSEEVIYEAAEVVKISQNVHAEEQIFPLSMNIGLLRCDPHDFFFTILQPVISDKGHCFRPLVRLISCPLLFVMVSASPELKALVAFCMIWIESCIILVLQDGGNGQRRIVDFHTPRADRVYPVSQRVSGIWPALPLAVMAKLYNQLHFPGNPLPPSTTSPLSPSQGS